jgi:hypothetical protein
MLPSADWLAVGLAVLGLVLSRFNFHFAALLALGVFGPSLLREVGVLKDSDEWQREIMHRAGFHTSLTLALFVFLNRVLPRFDHQFPELHHGLGVWFDVPFLWKTLVMVFLISYLLQYWGGRSGVARLLLGFGSVWLVDVLINFSRIPGQGLFLGVGLALVVFMYLLAWSAGRFPRPTGIILLFLMASLFVLGAWTLKDLSTEMAVGMVESQIHILLMFGVTGWALLRSHREESE